MNIFLDFQCNSTCHPSIRTMSDIYYSIPIGNYHKDTLPVIPKASVAVVIPKALSILLIIGMLMQYPLPIRDICACCTLILSLNSS